MTVRTELIAAVGRASEGQTVAWIGPSQALVRADFASIAGVVGDGVKVRRTNGDESIEFLNGGRIRFISSSGRGGRGFCCDRLYVPVDISEDDLMDLLPCVATSGDGAITAYA